MIRLQQLERQIARLERRAASLREISCKYWNVRRVIFIAGVLLAMLFCSIAGTRPAWIAAGLLTIAFSIVTIFHNRVRDSLTRISVLKDIKQVQIARIRLQWDRLPLSEPLPSLGDHPFASDLDIVGERSLHRLLDCAVTKEGSERLRSWLLSGRPDAELIEHRQALVQELKDLSVFRDKLQLLSAVARVSTSGTERKGSHHWNSRILVDWIERTGQHASLLPLVLVLSALSAVNIVCIALGALHVIRQIWPLTFLIYMGAMLLMQYRIATAWGELHDLEKALTHFKVVFSYLESRSYKNRPRLAEVCAPFLDRSKQPSREMKRLGRLAAALGLRTNPLLSFVVHVVVPWDFIFTHRLELLKKELAHLLPRWLDAWYELETLNSLANFAYLNPDYVLPELSSEPKRFSARRLGHPLLNHETKVCNDFELDRDQRIVILTGSNMAGKSTFLRTIGVNLCLTYAGAPVNAERLHTSLFRLFTCIKVSDSVQDGLSYFYAEVKRLQALLAAAEAADSLPLLFLIDEIFRGTNSRERLIGSRSYIRALSQSDSVGLVATHDLELIKLADEINDVVNLHFREEVSDGRMVFDYRLREGPCPTTNALTIMRLEGLPVDV